jgi:hypothetical protein
MSLGHYGWTLIYKDGHTRFTDDFTDVCVQAREHYLASVFCLSIHEYVNPEDFI